jgi:serine protease Do
MRVHFKILMLSVAVLCLPACGLQVEKAPLAPVLDAPEDAQPAPVAFNQIRFAIRSGTPTMASAPANIWDFIFFCDMPYGLNAQGSIRGRTFPTDSWREIFLDTLESEGYDVAGNPGRMFDETEDLQRAVYSVGGRITDVKINTCSQSHWLSGVPIGDSGEGAVTIEWTVFDMLNRRNAYKITTKGYAKMRHPTYDGLIVLFEEAMAASIHNLGADENFHNLIFFGEPPEGKDDTYYDPDEEPVTMYNPQEKVSLKALPVATEKAVGRLEYIRKATVMIEAGGGHGSGFFITEEGHILTNAHVVGNAVRVRVVSEGKQEKMIGEVLRVNRRRDVALVKLEKIPEGLDITVLPVRIEKPKVGEDVYAIGAPEMKKLQDTVTKGIVSAQRFDRKERQPYIQADVDTYPGSSGGPLVDGNGNIIGMTVLGYVIGDAGELGGLNWFIPIADALDKLEIAY